MTLGRHGAVTLHLCACLMLSILTQKQNTGVDFLS